MGFGLGMLALGILIYKGWSWVRHALVLGITAVGLSGFVSPEYEDVPATILVCVALFAFSIGVRYFYFSPEVIAYFTEKRGAEQVEDDEGASAMESKP